MKILFLKRYFLIVVSLLLAAPSLFAEEAGYIDVHLHLDGQYRQREGQRGGRMVKDFESAAENLIEHMKLYGVSKGLIMPPPQIRGQIQKRSYRDLLEIVKKYPGRLFLAAGGYTLNPIIHEYAPSEVTPEVKAMFEEEAEGLIRVGVKAFGEMSALHLSFRSNHIFSETWPDHPLFLLLADIAARHNVPIDLHMEAVPQDMDTPAGFARVSENNPDKIYENISGLEHLLAHNRDAKIVWQHIGWDNTGYMTLGLLRRLLKDYSNLYLALKIEEREVTMAGAQMPNRIVDENWKVYPAWMELIRDFPDRVMIGTDEFFGIPGKTPRRPQSFEETWGVLDQLPPDLARKVGRENAARIYNL